MTLTANDWAALHAERENSLDAVEAWLLADLLEKQPEAKQYAPLVAKLHRIADNAAQNH